MSNESIVDTPMGPYTTHNGIITQPGQFEGEPEYAPHFYNRMMEGDGEIVTGSDEEGEITRMFTRMDVSLEERHKFSQLDAYDVTHVDIWISENGFVWTDSLLEVRAHVHVVFLVGEEPV